MPLGFTTVTAVHTSQCRVMLPHIHSKPHPMTVEKEKKHKMGLQECSCCEGLQGVGMRSELH